jgi:FAD/FMN-containing dehydrogenase
MSKVSSYLQSHIVGEISLRADDRVAASRDQSIIEQKPEMVLYPRTTNDLRKLARFSSQLAAKGHVLPLYIRGLGRGVTGGSLGGGLVIDTSRHLNKIFEYDPKQKLVRLQAGVSVAALDSTLGLEGMALLSVRGIDGTVGGAVADDAGGIFAGTYGSISGNISQLEVVLDSGDVLQTGPINRRELNRRKGLQGREGDIYRGIDGILEDHAEYIAKTQKAGGPLDRSGYPGIFDIEVKQGQFDLTPLFVGSQGTLAIISEMIMKIDFIPSDIAYAVAVIEDMARLDATCEAIRRLSPSFVQIFDGDLIRQAARQGGNYEWLPGSLDQTKVVLVVGFDEMNEHVRHRGQLRLAKTVEKMSIGYMIPKTPAEIEQIRALLEVANFSATPFDASEQAAPVLAENIYVPSDKLSDFIEEINKLAAEAQLSVLLEGSILSSIYSLRVEMSLNRATDKQKFIKMISQFAKVVADLGGALVGAGGEGRLLSLAVRENWDEEYRQICDEIKQVFDPHGIFGVGVKSQVDPKDIAKILRNHN